MWMAGIPVDSLPVTLPAGNIPSALFTLALKHGLPVTLARR
jgi:hypothetical protein